MELQVHTPVVTRGRILLLSLLAAFLWLLVSVFSSTPAVANDDTEAGASLLDTVTATVAEITPVPTVTEPVAAVIDQVAQPLKPVVEPVTEQPMVATTLRVIVGAVNPTDALVPASVDDSITDAHTALAEAAPSALVANRPGPAAVRSTAAAPDTRATDVPAAGPFSSPESPAAPAPVAPASAPASSLGQNTGAPSLLAEVSAGGDSVALAGASAARVNFSLPSSPTFDSDTSPD